LDEIPLITPKLTLIIPRRCASPPNKSALKSCRDRQAIEDGYRAKIESDLLQRPVPIEARLRQNLLDTATSPEGYTYENLPGLFE
jgi:hypothetical protein